MKLGKMKPATLLLASVAITLLAFATPASAAHVQCGDTITATVVLDGDVTCGDGSNDVGLVLMENGITVRLNGFAILAGGNGAGPGSVSLDSRSGVSSSRAPAGSRDSERASC
jgi:hypothetical protein